MKAPNEIYIHLKGNPLEITFSEVEEKDCINTKYIRADLAELTWEDIKKIELLLFAIECSSARSYRGEDLYKEVLRRFLESKKEIEL